MNIEQAHKIFYKCKERAERALPIPDGVSFSYGAELPELARASLPKTGWSGFAYLPSDAEIALGVPYQVFINPEWNSSEEEIISTAFHELAHIAEWEHFSKARHKGQVFKAMHKACNKYLKRRGYFFGISKADFSNI